MPLLPSHPRRFVSESASFAHLQEQLRSRFVAGSFEYLLNLEEDLGSRTQLKVIGSSALPYSAASNRFAGRSIASVFRLGLKFNGGNSVFAVPAIDRFVGKPQLHQDRLA